MMHFRSRMLCLLLLMLLAGCSPEVGSSEVTEAIQDEQGLYIVNPFDFPTEAPFPKLEVPETSFNFGRTAIGMEGSHGFIIRNTGDAPVRLALGPKTCQCTLGSLDVDELEPGGETEVLLTWKPETHATEFSKSASIWTNVPEMPRINFTVEGQVVPEIIVMPGTEWSAGMVNDTEGSMLDGVVYSMLTPEFEVTSIEPSNDWLEVAYEEVSPAAIESMGGLKGYQVLCRVLPNCPLGEFRGTLTVHTDFESDEYSEVIITVSGSRSGPFNITGRGWSGTRYGLLDMGRVPLGEGKTVQLSLIMTPMDEPLELKLLSSDPEFIQFEMERDEEYPATNRERYYLTFSVPPDAEPGSWHGENAGTVTLSTNIPDREELSVRVDFSVENPN